jgi:sterol desaturase/sphingolipid hydroxylase (fatty acid hydroxylase superfamily)
MHTRALVRFHRWHHRSQVTTPLTGQSMSAVEVCGWLLGYVGLPWLYSQLVPISFWGWVAYLAFNVLGNVAGHANVEPTARAAATRTAALFVNPFVYHCLHHARWKGHYGFQAAFMDRLFGTEWRDWPALYARIVAGKPLTSLKERGSDA